MTGICTCDRCKEDKPLGCTLILDLDEETEIQIDICIDCWQHFVTCGRNKEGASLLYILSRRMKPVLTKVNK
jgi:hypothetical protein